MFLTRCLVIISFILNVHQVQSLPSDIDTLKEHFFANLIAETRPIANSQLTNSVERDINLKIEGFLGLISPPSTREKRDTNDLLLNEKATDVFILKGFQSRGFIPVNFPQDICMFQINEKIFAAGLSYGKINNGTLESTRKTKNQISVFIREDGKFRKIYEYKSKFLVKIDCEALGDAGFIAIVNKITDSDFKKPEDLLEVGSIILRITLDTFGAPKFETFQTFAFPNQNGVRLWLRGLNLYLVYSYDTFPTSQLNVCTVFKLNEMTFVPVDDLPCQNARAIELFAVHHDIMVLVGNYRENNGTSNAISSIFRFDLNLRKFVEHQKILTNAIVVGKYFFFDQQEQRQHFLFIGNSFEINEFGMINYEVPSMIYKFVSGFFIPMQTINVKQVQAMVPIVGKNHEFHLLIASEEHEVQIYFYDGWKFNESPIDFTGDSFGSGVVSIRTYDNIIKGSTTIVIANRDSFDPTWNVYTPIYAMKNDSSRLKSSISKWCNDALSRLEKFDIVETEEVLKSALELADLTSDRANFMGRVFIRNSTVGTITTKQLKGTRVSFNNETARLVNSLASRLEKLSIATQHVNNKIKFTKATRRTRRQTAPLVKTLIVDGSINIQTINGRPVADLVYTANQRNQRMKDVIAKEIVINKNLFVNQKIDSIEMLDDNLILNRPEQVLRPFTVDKLTVQNIDGVATVNSLPFAEFFKLLRRKVDTKIPNMIQELNVDSLTIGRFLNDRNFTGMAINSLKTIGDQIMTGPVSINQLTANNVMFQKVLRDQRLSDVPLSMLIDIDDKRRAIEINQDIRFENDVFINHLFVNERINNINVKNGQLQVMRTEGVEQQVVTGEKFFDQVNLLSPIVLRGKIESKTLQKMNPIITINEKLVLQGDYRITGPVSIRNSITATEDITTSNKKLSLKNLIENGLNLFTSNVSNNNFVFQNVVEVKRNLQVVSLNKKKVENFVKTDFSPLQIVRGLTTFKNGLMVHDGTVQADVVNDVDINLLNRTVLKRFSSVAQFIDGNVEIVSLKAFQLLSPKATINGKSIDLLLNSNEEQTISQMTLPSAKVEALTVEKMDQKAGGRIFGTDVNFLMDDAVMIGSSDISSAIASKQFNDLTVERLTFADENEWKSIIRNYENSIVQDINVTGNRDFANEMRIRNLVVTGTINDVSFEDMTKNWLKYEGDQTFTAPQTFTSLTVENLNVPSGLINGYNVSRMINDSIWIDQPIYVKNLEIESEMKVLGKVLAPTVNGMNLDGKLILNNTNEHQTLNKIIVEKDLLVEFINFTNLNGIDCGKMMNVFSGNVNGSGKLRIHGSAFFNDPPEIAYLNNQNVKELYESVWMSDMDVELTGDDIQFLGGVRVDGNFIADTINQQDLFYISQNYFSLSSNQNIGSYLNINGTMSSKKSFSTQKTIVQGSIRTDENDRVGFKIEQFANSILLTGKDQKITGNWSVNELIINGDYIGTINGLNFNEDVLHTGNWHTAEVTGHKRFLSVETYNINASHVNQIDIMDWYQNAVNLNSSIEQNIDGHVDLGQAVFYEDLEVYGLVNGLIINPETVLTKSGEFQVIAGNLTIKTMTPQEVKSSFIENLYLQYGINGKNITDIYLNTLKTSDTKISSRNLIFERKLVAGSIETDQNIYGVNVAEFLKKSDASVQLVKFQQNLEYLLTVSESLKKSNADVAIELSHFEHHQSIPGVNIQKTIPITIRFDSVDFVLAIYERITNSSFETISFYRWLRNTNTFVNDGSMNPLQYNFQFHQITGLEKIVKNGIDHLYVEVFDESIESFIQNLMLFDPQSKTFVAVLQTKSLAPTRVFTLDDGSSACYGSFILFAENLNIICDGQPMTILKTPPIRSASSQNGIIILLTVDRQLQIWHENKMRQVLKLMNPQSFTCIRFGGKFYIAVTLDKVDQSIHHGSIEIFESNDDIDFKLVQSVELENPFLVQFSVIPSHDLLLYVLSRNAGKTLSIYKYAGASYFVETIGSSTIVNTGRDLRTMSIDGKREFIAIVSSDVFIIEAVIKIY